MQKRNIKLIKRREIQAVDICRQKKKKSLQIILEAKCLQILATFDQSPERQGPAGSVFHPVLE